MASPLKTLVPIWGVVDASWPMCEEHFRMGKTEQLTLQMVLQRLEAIHTGFIEWSNILEK